MKLVTRAQRYRDTLADLAVQHDNSRLAALAERVDKEWCQSGKDFVGDEEGSILLASADCFKKEEE
jgi:hypothetical protein